MFDLWSPKVDLWSLSELWRTIGWWRVIMDTIQCIQRWGQSSSREVRGIRDRSVQSGYKHADRVPRGTTKKRRSSEQVSKAFAVSLSLIWHMFQQCCIRVGSMNESNSSALNFLHPTKLFISLLEVLPSVPAPSFRPFKTLSTSIYSLVGMFIIIHSENPRIRLINDQNCLKIQDSWSISP